MKQLDESKTQKVKLENLPYSVECSLFLCVSITNRLGNCLPHSSQLQPALSPPVAPVSWFMNRLSRADFREFLSSSSSSEGRGFLPTGEPESSLLLFDTITELWLVVGDWVRPNPENSESSFSGLLKKKHFKLAYSNIEDIEENSGRNKWESPNGKKKIRQDED